MKEQDVILKTIKPNTVESLINEFKGMGISKGDVLLTHSSLSSLGWVCGEQVAVVTALLKVLGQEGTLVMPAHTGGNSDPEKWENPPVLYYVDNHII